MNRCLFCRKILILKQRMFCSNSHKWKYVRLSKNHFASIFPKNVLRKSMFFNQLELKEQYMKKIIEKRWSIETS